MNGRAPAEPTRAERLRLLGGAFALALAAAVSLGLARFSYPLVLPAMRADLGWTYFTAGAMNTLNAAGYLLGALLLPRALARVDARLLMLAGGYGATLFLTLHGFTRDDTLLFVLRAAAGLASAFSFAVGGLLAARLAATPAGAGVGGLVLGLYYGGTGVGIIGSAALASPWMAAGGAGWPNAWMALGAAALLSTALTAVFTRSLRAPPGPAARRERVEWRPLAFGLAGYVLFGAGYIGYMTFIITLLREQGMAGSVIVAFYMLLGAGVVASSWLWAGLLQRERGGVPMAVFNSLLAVATLLPLLSVQPVMMLASGLLFGSVFLSIVASTTALVRHNLPAAQWPTAIAVFTIVFAAGQIVGPAWVGWIADGPGGLLGGFGFSAATLALGAVLASRQRAFGPG